MEPLHLTYQECPECVFLGHEAEWDLYFCTQPHGFETIPALMAVNPHKGRISRVAVSAKQCQKDPVFAAGLKQANQRRFYLHDQDQRATEESA